MKYIIGAVILYGITRIYFAWSDMKCSPDIAIERAANAGKVGWPDD